MVAAAQWSKAVSLDHSCNKSAGRDMHYPNLACEGRRLAVKVFTLEETRQCRSVTQTEFGELGQALAESGCFSHAKAMVEFRPDP